jgi:hypothetical protein
MRKFKLPLAIGLVASMCVVVHGRAQSAAQRQQAQMQQMQKLQSAMADAQAKATRPGDAGMSCDALQGELQAAALDPALQTAAKENGAVAQEKLDELGKGTAEAKAAAATQVGLGIFTGLASAFVPGASTVTGESQLAAARAQAAQSQAQAARNLQDIGAMMDRMIPVLPQLMRGQRVLQLAAGKQCAWMAGVTPPGGNPGVNPFAPPKPAR